MRICVMYDCLFPWTVGGGERWLRDVSERLAADGHEVTYLTLTQWKPGEEPQIPGLRVVAIGKRHHELYDGERRKIGPPLRFGAGVLWHLLRHGRRYDVVHTSSFPYFSLLAAGLVRRLGGYRIVCDWFEVWSKAYWIGYLGPKGGRVGWAVQRACTHIRQEPHVLAQLYATRLRELNPKLDPMVLTGLYGGSLELPAATDPPAVPHVVYAGRWIAEKRIGALLPALELVREAHPALRVTLLGDGPERERVLAQIQAGPWRDYVDAPGFVAAEQVDATFAEATVVVQPSSREGYGLVVVESAARGIPVVVVDGADNAATELVDEGRNGFVAPSIEAEPLAGALLAAIDGGAALRATTRIWFAQNAGRVSLESSLERLSASYGSR